MKTFVGTPACFSRCPVKGPGLRQWGGFAQRSGSTAAFDDYSTVLSIHAHIELTETPVHYNLTALLPCVVTSLHTSCIFPVEVFLAAHGGSGSTITALQTLHTAANKEVQL